MRIEKAEYNKAILPEHQGNPFIEALPVKKDEKELMISFGNYPPYSELERELPALAREEYTGRIKKLKAAFRYLF